jgi:hypothetical protein
MIRPSLASNDKQSSLISAAHESSTANETLNFAPTRYRASIKGYDPLAPHPNNGKNVIPVDNLIGSSSSKASLKSLAASSAESAGSPTTNNNNGGPVGTGGSETVDRVPVILASIFGVLLVVAVGFGITVSFTSC